MNSFTKAKFSVLTAIVVLSWFALSACSEPASRASTQAVPAAQSAGGANAVEVVYFHRAQRCVGCLQAEAAIRKTIESYFRDDLASGNLVFKVLNLQDDSNAASVKKYGAHTSSLFISGSVENGRAQIEEVTGIWLLLGNDDAFAGLLRGEIDRRLRG